MSEREDCRRCGGPFFVIGNIVPVIQKRSAGMRTAAYNVDVASDRRRRKNVPGHITKETVYGQENAFYL